MTSLLAELKRRNVYKVAFAYLILGWLVLQITDVVAPALRLPVWTMSLVTYLGLIGFPFALLFTWAFELTPDGLKRSTEVDPSYPSPAKPGKPSTASSFPCWRWQLHSCWWTSSSSRTRRG